MRFKMAIYWLLVTIGWCLSTITLAFPENRIPDLSNDAGPTSDDVITTPKSTEDFLDLFVSELVKLKPEVNKTNGWHLTGQVASLTDNHGQNENEDDEHAMEDPTEEILQDMLRQIHTGYVTQTSVSRWLTQIKEGIAKGTITWGNFNNFLGSLPNAGLRMKFTDLCCLLG